MTKLEKASHLSVIAVCCLAAGLLIENRFFPPQQAAPSRPRLLGREVSLPGANWQSAPVSVLLEISSTCPYCNASMPFYRQLMAARQAAGAKIPVLVASADAVAVMQKHLADQQVSVDKVLHSPPEGFDTGTPTVFVVDNKGVVKRAFVGQLDATREQQLLGIVERGKV